MTKDEAAQIISRAILAEGNQQHILGADAFAARLATALDATGLLNLADVYGVAPANQDDQLAQDLAPVGPSAPAGARLADQSLNTPPPAQGGGPEYWATKRQRS